MRNAENIKHYIAVLIFKGVSMKFKSNLNTKYKEK